MDQAFLPECSPWLTSDERAGVCWGGGCGLSFREVEVSISGSEVNNAVTYLTPVLYNLIPEPQLRTISTSFCDPRPALDVLIPCYSAAKLLHLLFSCYLVRT